MDAHECFMYANSMTSAANEFLSASYSQRLSRPGLPEDVPSEHTVPDELRLDSNCTTIDSHDQIKAGSAKKVSTVLAGTNLSHCGLLEGDIAQF